MSEYDPNAAGHAEFGHQDTADDTPDGEQITLGLGNGTETLIDSDHDGYADEAIIDTDGDGHPDEVLSHTFGPGHQFDTVGIDRDADGRMDVLEFDRDHDGKIDLIEADRNGDGRIDEIVSDDDHDGRADHIQLDNDFDGRTDVDFRVDDPRSGTDLRAGMGLGTDLAEDGGALGAGTDADLDMLHYDDPMISPVAPPGHASINPYVTG